MCRAVGPAWASPYKEVSMIRSRMAALAALIALAGAGYWLSGCSQRAEAAPRPVTPRGALTGEERSTIDMFEASKGSVVFISTTNRVVDFWTRDVMSVPAGTGSGFVWDDRG